MEIKSVKPSVTLAGLEVHVRRYLSSLGHVPSGENEFVSPACVTEGLRRRILSEGTGIHPILQQSCGLMEQVFTRKHYFVLVGVIRFGQHLREPHQ